MNVAWIATAHSVAKGRTAFTQKNVSTFQYNAATILRQQEHLVSIWQIGDEHSHLDGFVMVDACVSEAHIAANPINVYTASLRSEQKDRPSI